MNCSGNRNRLRAFTLPELLVGMVVSGIVLTATFSAFRIVSRQAGNYRSAAGRALELSFFSSQLETDFIRAENAVLISANELQLGFPGRTLQYRFTGSRVLRSDGPHTDTFFVAVQSFAAFRRAQPVTGTQSVTDEIRLSLEADGVRQEKSCRRMPDAKTELITEEEEFIRQLNH